MRSHRAVLIAGPAGLPVVGMIAGHRPSGRSEPLPPDAVVLDFPFHGSWRVENSPARRVPSHGTYAFGSSHAIDFVRVDSRGRSAPPRWQNLLASEAPEKFLGFGAPILAPLTGVVVATHDGEPDHEARRSQLRLLLYAAGQRKRARAGVGGLAGNFVVISAGPTGPFVLLAHLRKGTVRVRPGQSVRTGDPLAHCGNSGNSTEPHVHLQVSDSTHWAGAHGVPVAFRGTEGTAWVPREAEIVDA